MLFGMLHPKQGVAGKESMRSRRAAVQGLLAVAALSALPAGTRVSAAASADQRGPVTFVTGKDLTGYLQQLLDGWNRVRPDEPVTLIQLPEAADDVYAQMVDGLRSGGSRFDVLNIDVSWTSEFAGSGWIAPLDGQRLPLDSLLPHVLDTATFRGALYAAPYVTNAGLLYYRKDLLDGAGLQPPRTYAELEHAAATVAPRSGVGGYAGQFFPYEGLTVNLSESVESAGGSILADDGTKVTVDSAAARQGLEFLVRGVREGWIPRDALTYKEEESRLAFVQGELLFLRNWPYVYDSAGAADSKVAGRFGVAPLPGSSVLGGSNLAVNARSRHPQTAADLLAYLMSGTAQRQVLVRGSLPPVRASLYTDPALVRRFPYLPILRRSVESAQPRPKSARYDQVSLAVAALTSDALNGRLSPARAIATLGRDLREIVAGG